MVQVSFQIILRQGGVAKTGDRGGNIGPIEAALQRFGGGRRVEREKEKVVLLYQGKFSCLQGKIGFDFDELFPLPLKMGDQVKVSLHGADQRRGEKRKTEQVGESVEQVFFEFVRDAEKSAKHPDILRESTDKKVGIGFEGCMAEAVFPAAREGIEVVDDGKSAQFFGKVAKFP